MFTDELLKSELKFSTQSFFVCIILPGHYHYQGNTDKNVRVQRVYHNAPVQNLNWEYWAHYESSALEREKMRGGYCKRFFHFERM